MTSQRQRRWSPYKYLAPPSQGHVSAEKWVRVPILKSICSLLSPCESLSKSLRQIRCSGGKTTEWRLQTFWCVASIQLHIYAWKSLWAVQAKWFDAQVPPMPFVSFMGLLPHLLWYFNTAVSSNRGFSLKKIGIRPTLLSNEEWFLNGPLFWTCLFCSTTVDLNDLQVFFMVCLLSLHYSMFITNHPLLSSHALCSKT